MFLLYDASFSDVFWFLVSDCPVGGSSTLSNLYHEKCEIYSFYINWEITIDNPPKIRICSFAGPREKLNLSLDGYIFGLILVCYGDCGTGMAHSAGGGFAVMSCLLGMGDPSNSGHRWISEEFPRLPC